jgi:hypothetical protein
VIIGLKLHPWASHQFLAKGRAFLGKGRAFLREALMVVGRAMLRIEVGFGRCLLDSSQLSQH